MIPLFLYHEIATKTNYHETMFFCGRFGSYQRPYHLGNFHTGRIGNGRCESVPESSD